jgi:haloalkane dehalogenase
LLVPITADDPERARCDAAWEVFRQWHKPVLTLFGDHCPHTNADLGRSYQSEIPGASLPGIEHRVLRASHFIQEDMGEELVRHIVAFMQRTPLTESRRS